MSITFTSTSTKGTRLQQAGDGNTTLEKGAGNLLIHIPGEASGFYLMAVAAFGTTPSKSTLGLLFVLSVIILLLVRWCAKASLAVIFTSLLAFIIWMFVLEDGLFKQMYPELIPEPLGLIIAGFFSAVVTILATAGKIR